MATHVSYDWARSRRRWRRWIARLFALLALAACGAGVYGIVHEATRPEPPTPVDFQPELQPVAASSVALARELGTLAPGRSRVQALALVHEAQSDRDAASARLLNRTSARPVRDAALIAGALDAHRRYLSAVASVLRDPRGSAVAGRLRARARKARAAWSALPDPSGLPQTIRGWRKLLAVARAARR
jgi:hypothetical protein